MANSKGKEPTKCSGWLHQLEAIHIRYYRSLQASKQDIKNDTRGRNWERYDRDK